MPKSPNDRPYPVLDLFAGIGGFTLAFEASGFRTLAFSEIDPYASAVLAHRFPAVPNLGPVQSVTRDSLLARCGELPVVVTGGFPCQPHSLAGKRGSVIDPRDLWDECVRVLRDIRPRFALFENVAGLLTSGSYTDAADGELGAGLFLNRVCSDLAAIRYACQWQVVSAADVGAPHRRDRIWLLCVDELGLADAASERTGGGLGLRGAERGQGSALLRDAERSSGGAEGVVWPAAHGLWPARPGQRQFGWEPSRVVAQPPRLGREQGDTDAGGSGTGSVAEQGTGLGGGGDARRVNGGRGVPAAPESLGAERHGQAESLVGGNFAGFSDRVDAAADEVREAADIDFTFNDAREAGWDAANVNNLAEADLAALVERDEGPQAQGDAVNRVPRLKALGNAIVPAVAHIFALAIYEQLVAMESAQEVSDAA